MSAVEKTGGSGFADKYDVFVMPTKQTSSSFIGGSNLVVFKNTKAGTPAGSWPTGSPSPTSR